MPRVSSRFRQTAVIAAAILLAAKPCLTRGNITATWTLLGPDTSALWSTAADWSTAPVVPMNDQPVGALYDVVIHSGVAIQLDINPVIQNLTMTGTFTGPGTLTANGLLSADALFTTANIVANGGMTIGSNSLFVNGGTVTNAAGATALLNGSGPSIVVNGGTFVNYGTVSANQIGASIFQNNGTTGRFINNGLVVSNVANAFGISANFINNGTLSVNSGLTTISVTETASAGTVLIAAGATLNLSAGNHNFLPSSIISGAGMLLLSTSGTTTLGGAFNVSGPVTLLNGYLAAATPIAVNGFLTVSGGHFLSDVTAAAGLSVGTQGSFITGSALTLGAGNTVTLTGNTLTLQNNGSANASLVNNGLLQIQGGTSLVSSTGTANRLINNSIININGPLTISGLSELQNNNQISATSTTIFMNGSCNLSGGGTLLLGGASVVNLSFNNLTSNNFISGLGVIGNGAGIFTNNGTIQASSGTLSISASFNNYGILQANGGVLKLLGNYTGGTYQAISNSVLLLNARSLTNARLLSANGGIIYAGTLTTSGVLAMSGTINNEGYLRVTNASLSGTLTNSGSIVMTGSSDSSGGTLSSASNASVIFNSGSISGVGAIAGAITNTGTITGASSSFSGSLTIGAGTTSAHPLLNNGVIRSDYGILSLSGVIDNTNGLIESRNVPVINITPENPSQAQGGLRISGTITGGTLGFSNGNILINNSVISGTSIFASYVGSLTFNSGTINLSAPIIIHGEIVKSNLPYYYAYPTISFNSTSPNSQNIASIIGDSTSTIGGKIIIGPGASLVSDQIETEVDVGANAHWTIRPHGPNAPVSVVLPQTIKSTATININDNNLLLSVPGFRLGLLFQFNNLLHSGYNSGDWQGMGINSGTVAADNSATGSHLTTLALYDNADLNLTSFAGQPIGTNAMFVTTALIGDANFDNHVDAADLQILANNWMQTSQSAASRGDLNFDNTVDLSDLALLATHWQSPQLYELSVVALAPLAAALGTVTLGSYSGTGPISIAGGRLALAPTNAPRGESGVVVKVQNLTIAAGAALDVSNHDLIIGNTTYAAVQSMILAGFGVGSGPAITTSTSNVLGTGSDNAILIPIDASAFGVSSWDNVSITDPNSIVVKYALFGDASLDGVVNIDDYAILAGNFNHTTPGMSDMITSWLKGDFSLDGVVNIDDYAILAGNFNKGPMAAWDAEPAALSVSPVPEPASLLLLGVAGVAVSLLRPKRRRWVNA